MKRLVFSPAAQRDFDAIWDYSADAWGVDQADDYTGLIHAACEALAGGRTAGRPTDVRSGYRKQRAGSHVIYFQVQETGITVIRLLHVAQDVERNLPHAH